MAGRSTQATKKTQVRAWMQSIPLGSLEQLRNAFAEDGGSRQVYSTASNIPLPGSNATSIASTVNEQTSPVSRVVRDSPPTCASNDDESGRTTSADSLWQLQHARDAPYHVPLPESARPSREQLSLDDAKASDQIGNDISSHDLLNPRRPKADGPDMLGAAPKVIVTAQMAERRVADAIGAISPRPMRRRNYWQSTAPLMDCLPHLQAIQPDLGRYKNNGFITFIDYFRDRRLAEVHGKLSIGQSDSRRSFTDRLMEMKVISDPLVTTRVVLVEDLSPGIIESLGSTFELDPEFFAEHLNRSGYNGVDYEDELPSRWETHGMPKAHACLKWYRPVHENPKITQWLESPQSLLERIEGPTAAPSRPTDASETCDVPRLRRAATMTARILGGKQGGHVRDETNDLSNASERRKIPGSITWSDSLYKANGKRDRLAVQHQAVVTTNIFRQSWLLSTRPGDGSEAIDAPSRWTLGSKVRKNNKAFSRPAHVVRKSSEDAWESSAAPTAWEEKASFFHYRKSSVPIIILLLDPLPAITDFTKSLYQPRADVDDRSTNSGITVKPEERPMDMGLPIVTRAPRAFPPNKFDATLEDIERLKSDTSTLRSTGEAICIGGPAELQDWSSFRGDPVLALLRVLQNDTKAFFQCLEWALDEISEDSLDDYLMSKRLEDWRRLMSDFEIKVPEIGKSLQDFAFFVFHDEQGTSVPDEITLIVKDVQSEVERVHHRLIEAYGALRADMQFTEARRSINEAKTVTKLTELAFLFIPLSFTCSLFSMQIKELSGGVPVWTFVVTALAIAILAYMIRLVLASDFIADSSRSALEKFWSRRGVRKGDSAPVVTLVLLTVQDVWQKVGAQFSAKALYAMLLASFVVVPVAFMWTKTRMDIGFDLAMTFFLVLSGLALGIGLFVDAGSIGERVTGWRGDTGSVTSSGEDV